MKVEKVNRDFDKKIVEAITKKFPVVAWNSINSVIYKTQLTLKAYRKDYSELEFNVPEESIEEFSKLLEGGDKFRVYLPDLSIAFSLVVKQYSDPKMIKVFIPESFTFHERRNHERVKPDRLCYAYINFKNATPRVNIFDVSLGGFSVVYPKSLKVDIKEEEIYSNISLDIYGHKITGKFECVNTVSLDPHKVEALPYGGFKVAFRFVEIQSRDLDYLREFISTKIIQASSFKKAE